MELEPLNLESNISDIENKQSEHVPDKHKSPERANWGNRVEFVLALIGFTVGIGSVWRFPILCARNGTGAFLIPFFIFMVLCGLPLYYIEVALGQFCGKSAGIAFDFCPLFKGNNVISFFIFPCLFT